MSATVLHFIEEIVMGGGYMAAISAAKCSSTLSDIKHCFTPVKTGAINSEAACLAGDIGIEVLAPKDLAEQVALMEQADIVHLDWWNSPSMDAFLRSDLPAARMVASCHIGGHIAPQVITPNLVNFVDHIVACSPVTYDCPAIQSLGTEARLAKASMIYTPAHFKKLQSYTPIPHSGFNVGYVGTVDYCKMHPNYFSMSAAIQIPDIRFIICGGGEAGVDILYRAKAAGMGERFALLGFVKEVSEVLSLLDVYGYPLCEDNYSACELNLQEVMYCGIPAVVFPYGGVSKLIIDNFTGLVVKSEIEYRQAIEYLYQHPEERKRLGSNAREYAKQIFSTEPVGRKLNQIYESLLSQPKKTHHWGAAGRGSGARPPSGAEAFIESLGSQGGDFLISATGTDLEQVMQAEQRIKSCSRLMFVNGILSYSRHYRGDPLLKLWSGLACFGSGNLVQAWEDFLQAAHGGLEHWRLLWYLAQVAQQGGKKELAQQLLNSVRGYAPTFLPAQSELV